MSEIARDVSVFNIGEIQFEDDTLNANRKRLLDCAQD